MKLTSIHAGRLPPLALVLISAVAAVAAYLQALHYPFISDDSYYIADNSKLINLHFAELWRLLIEPHNSLAEFLPLRDLSYWIDITLFGLSPAAFRLHNITLYLLCLPLIYGATLSVWRYFRPTGTAAAQWIAGTVTALFAIHPAHAEAVVWISGRKDLLSGMFSVLAIWLAMLSRREHGFSSLYAAATLLALSAALLSKATAVAAAAVIALLWVVFWFNLPAHSRRRFLLLWPLASLLLAACMTLIVMATSNTRTPVYFGMETITRALGILGNMFRLTAGPENRHFFYPVFEDPLFYAMVALGAGILVAAVAGTVMLLRRRSLAGFCMAAFMLFCLPSMQLIPYQPPSLISDRFLFLAVWPAILLAVALAWRLNPMPRTVLLLALSVPWVYQTIERPRDWHSVEKLMDADLRAFPGHPIPALLKIAELTTQGRYPEANAEAGKVTVAKLRTILVKLVRVGYAVNVDAKALGKPDYAMAELWDIGLLLKQAPVEAQWDTPIRNFWSRCQRAVTALWKFLASDFPDNVSVRYNAGLWLLNINQDEDAATYFRAATESPHLPQSVRGTAFKNLGLALLRSGHIAEAESPLQTALEQSPPDLRAYCLLAEVYKRTGRPEKAGLAQASCP